jgi:hypothetical protein
MENSSVILKKSFQRDSDDGEDDGGDNNKKTPSRIRTQTTKRFFVGDTRYRIVRPEKEFQVLDYIRFVIGSGYTTMSNFAGMRDDLLLVRVMLYMFQAIMSYNSIMDSGTYSYRIVDQNVYPDFMVFDDMDKCFYFQLNAIQEHLESEAAESVNVVINSNACNNTENYRKQYPGKVVRPQVLANRLYKLFVIVDHCATHVTELLCYGKTDYVCHSQFGNKHTPLITLNNAMQITTMSKPPSSSSSSQQQRTMNVTSSYEPTVKFITSSYLLPTTRNNYSSR